VIRRATGLIPRSRRPSRRPCVAERTRPEWRKPPPKPPPPRPEYAPVGTKVCWLMRSSAADRELIDVVINALLLAVALLLRAIRSG